MFNKPPESQVEQESQAPDPQDVERAWQVMILQGNAHFEQRRYPRAAAIYQDALRLAHASVYDWRNVCDALAAVVVSQHNLCAVHAAMNELPSAAQQLCALHEWLLDISKNTLLALDLRVAALKQVSRTFVELKTLHTSHPDIPGPGYWLENSCVCEAWTQCSSRGQTLH
jgi:hypothetical protein